MMHTEANNGFGLPQGDIARLAEAPTAQTLLGIFNDNQLGRAIEFVQQQPFALNNAPKESQLAGYILPLNKDQLRHLVYLGDGSIFIIEPQDKKSPLTYQIMCSPDSHPVRINASDNGYKTASEIAFEFTAVSALFKSREVLRNDRKKNADRIQTMLDQAITLGFSLQEERTRQVFKSTERGIERLLEGPVPLVDETVLFPEETKPADNTRVFTIKGKTFNVHTDVFVKAKDGLRRAGKIRSKAGIPYV